MRGSARALKAFDILQKCDNLRDNVLPELGVRLEDRELSDPAVFKVCVFFVDYFVSRKCDFFDSLQYLFQNIVDLKTCLSLFDNGMKILTRLKKFII